MFRASSPRGESVRRRTFGVRMRPRIALVAVTSLKPPPPTINPRDKPIPATADGVKILISQVSETFPKLHAMKMTTPLVFSIVLALLYMGLLPEAQAVSPPPDGGYPGGNTAEGQSALLGLTSGIYNTAIGLFSLTSNTEGKFNTATGAGTLLVNTADQNTATGAGALLSNTIGVSNTADGAFALFSNTTGNSNTAIGLNALLGNTEGSNNTANGIAALSSNTTGNANTASGFEALGSNTIGGGNAAAGSLALFSNTTGSNNTACGRAALSNNTSGSHNTVLGNETGDGVTTANNVICIGDGVSGQNVSNSCYIGQIYSNVQPIVGTDPDYVTINGSNRLGRGNVSSRRYKHDIQPMGKASEVLFALKPVSIRYKREYDATQTIAFGLIAEEVGEVNPDLIGCNDRGQPESVRYEQINAMLLNEFLKEHGKVQELNSTVAKQGRMIAQQQREFQATTMRQEKEIQALTAGMKEQATQIQKVRAQIELSNKTPQITNNQ